MSLFWIAPFGAIAGLVFAWIFFQQMKKSDPGSRTQQGIAAAVRAGAFAYLFRQYRVVGIVFLCLSLIFVVLAYLGIQNPFVPVAFLTGGFFSGLCGFLGMNSATLASNRTATAASKSLNQGLRVAFQSGGVMGLVVVGFGLLDIVLWYVVLDRMVFTPDNMKNGLSFLGLWLVPVGTDEGRKYAEITTTMLTFGMGASTQALFARVGGGIFTKAADVGSDLVGKVEAGIPEDDPRNPATIADNVGDNVGDVAGMGADLYESYCGSIVATAALGAAALPYMTKAHPDLYGGHGDLVKLIVAPMVVAGIGTLLSILGMYLVRTKEGASQRDLLRALLLGTASSSVFIVIALAVLAYTKFVTWGVFWAVVAGLVGGVIIGQATEYYTDSSYKPCRGIATQAKMGPATTIIEGMAVGMFSTWVPVLIVVGAMIAAYWACDGFINMSAGLYGVGFAAVGMLSTLGITLATDAYGPIADNAGGNAEMSGMPHEVRNRTDALDALGNTTAATGKGFAIGSAALTALALLASYLEEVRIWLGRMIVADKTAFHRVGDTFFVNQGEALRDAQQAVQSSITQSLQAHGGAAPNLDASQWSAMVDKVAATGHAVLMAGDSTFRMVQLDKAEITDFVRAFDLTITNPLLLGGLFIGAMMSFVFVAMAMKAVGRAAGAMVEEVRRQFRSNPGIMEFKPGDDSPENQARKPDYARCVDISTAGAQREMVVPALLAISAPVATGLILGPQGVMGLLAGALAAGFVLATMLNNAGGSWDNAKKFIEAGNFGGKYLKNDAGEYVNAKGEKVTERSDAKNPVHGAAVIGDTVGDPFKDTCGPAMNILIKLMAMVSVVFAGVVLAHNLIMK